jgi:hypothetical protein
VISQKNLLEDLLNHNNYHDDQFALKIHVNALNSSGKCLAQFSQTYSGNCLRSMVEQIQNPKDGQIAIRVNFKSLRATLQSSLASKPITHVEFCLKIGSTQSSCVRVKLSEMKRLGSRNSEYTFKMNADNGEEEEVQKDTEDEDVDVEEYDTEEDKEPDSVESLIKQFYNKNQYIYIMFY